ncbi:MAG: hypothetical protein HZA93_24955 [Verrucomicrobia bacterium]|nr:hypothetical protein [Verrucomicrobiota bacterium]
MLEACRPNGADAGDPPMVAALAEAKRDPALVAWLAREQAHAAAVAVKLSEVTPPPGLRDAILAGGRISQPPQPRRVRRVPSWLVAAAAAMLLGLGGMAWWWPWRISAASGDLVAFAAKDTERHLMHGGHGAAAAELQRAMAEPTRRLAGAALPVNFAALRDTGCRTLSVGGREVLEVCFKRDGHWFHCYVGRRGDFPALAAAEPVFAQHGKMGVASWTDAAHVYVLASEAGRTALTRLL